MPMNFPDMESLKRAATVHKFREPLANETEAEFREALATHVKLRDKVAAYEIKTGKGWDMWSTEDQKSFLFGMLKG